MDKGFKDLVLTRRSIRAFQKKKVEKEKVDFLITCGLAAPSSRARRPWELIVVDDGEKLEGLSQSREHGANFLADAPLAIVVAANPELCDVWVEDASILASYIQLAAHSLGLGSCWIQVRERVQKESVPTQEVIKTLLSIPAHYKVECVIAVGYPAEEKKPVTEESLLRSKVHFNAF